MAYGIISICDIKYILNIQNECRIFNHLKSDNKNFPSQLSIQFFVHRAHTISHKTFFKRVVPSHAKLFLTSTTGKLSKRL